MNPKYLAMALLSLFGTQLSAQLTSRPDSQRFALALTHVIVSTASLPGNQPLGRFVVDTLVAGWNPFVAVVIREEHPGTLLDQNDSTAAYAVRLDVTAKVSAEGAPVVTALWSLCNAQYRREAGRLLRYDGVQSGGIWSFTQERSMLSGSGVCSYGLNRRAR